MSSSTRFFGSRPSGSAQAIFAALTPIVLIVSSAAGADRGLKDTTSLGFVPADVAFYSSTLRGREIYDRVAGSNAVKKFRDSATFKMGLAAIQMQMLDPENPLSQIQSELMKPENAELVALLGDMFSQEAFIYGNPEWTRLYKFYFELYRDIYGEMFNPENINRLGQNQEMMFDLFGDVIDRLSKQEVPTLVAGFRVSDTERAKRQLARLQQKLTPLVDSNPLITGRLRRESIAGTQYLTFKLDGGLIQWDEIEAGMTGEREKELFRKFRKDIERRVIAFALGVRGDYVLLTVGPSLEHVADLGNGELLADRAELAPVVKMADRPLASVNYMSKGFAEQMGFGEGTLDYWVATAKVYVAVFSMMGPISEAGGKKMVADIEALGRDLRPLIPDRGVVLSFSYLTGRGLEGYYYDHGETGYLDGSQPLTLLDHVGGDPLFFWVTRLKHNPAHYDLLAKWVKRSLAHVDVMAKDSLDEEQQEEYGQAREALDKLLARIDKANRKMLLPAFRDGQVALVVDAESTSNSWCPELPPAPHQLPMAEPALVFGISDADLLARGVNRYATAIQTALDTAHKIAPADVPPLKIPPPQVRTVKAGKLYAYPLPDELQIDPQIEPNAGVSDGVLVLSAFPGQTQRLLRKTPLTADGLPLARHDRPLAAATYFNVSALIEAAEPWAKFALMFTERLEENGNADNGDGSEDAPLAAGPDYADMVQSAVELLKCVRGYSSVSYTEDDTHVTHYEWRFQDSK